MIKEYIIAFVIGGIICSIGQLLIDLTKLTPARILVGYVLTGVTLTAIGVYERFVEFAGCGASVPLTGFGFSIAKGVEKAVEENGLIGALTGGLSATSAGITAAMLSGLLASFIFKSKEKE